jgi:hypothetical protein
MFVIVKTQSIFPVKFVDTFLIYSNSKFHVSNYNILLVIAIEPENEHNSALRPFCYSSLYENYFNQVLIFLECVLE